jgi:hypothetical protein
MEWCIAFIACLPLLVLILPVWTAYEDARWKRAMRRCRPMFVSRRLFQLLATNQVTLAQLRLNLFTDATHIFSIN